MKALVALAVLGLGSLAFVCLLAGGALFYFESTAAPCTGPNCPPSSPCPGPGPCPICPDSRPKPRKPWGTEAASVEAPRRVGKIQLGGSIAPDGATEIQVDMPVAQRMANIGSRRDGAGMCVMTSIEMASRWANLPQLKGLRDWCAQQPGGAYPSKVDRQLKEFCAAKGIVCPDYVQYEGNDSRVLEMALATGRLPAATYSGQDGVRYRGTIAHMITVAHFDGKNWVAILDNNGSDPRLGCLENELLWMSPSEYVQRWKSGGGGWMFCWLGPPPLPIPVN